MVGEMGDASEAYEKILCAIAESLEKNKKIKKLGFNAVVGYELKRVYKCACGKKN